MTISFIPGEVNDNENTIIQANWKNHHLLIYGSGNNLIITGATLTTKNKKPTPHNVDRILQTIYLESDPISINYYKDGIILLCLKNKLILFNPINEYMKFPKWTFNKEFTFDSEILNFKLAIEESEIIVYFRHELRLYYLYDEYREYKLKQRWKFKVNDVDQLYINSNASMILTTTNPYDRLLKCWQRISSGDNTLFEVSYLKHDKGTYIKKFHYRKQQERVVKNNEIDSFANISKIRGYINNSNGVSDIIYTLTSNKFHVWASYEFSSHNHVCEWSNLELDEEPLTFLVIEQELIKDIFNLDSDYDLLFLFSRSGDYKIYAICNVLQYPPNNVKFIELGQFKLGDLEWPEKTFEAASESIPLNDLSRQSISISPISLLNNDERIKQLSISIHDRYKHNIRFEYIDPENIAKGFHLINRYQGHTKSIRKLIKSNSLFTNSNILLSISNFKENNYIWEPIDLQVGLSLTRKFKLITTSRCINSVILNDIEPIKDGKRRHLIVTYEENKSINVWDCNKEETAHLIINNKIDIDLTPRVFFMIEYPDNTQAKKSYCVIAIYETNIIHSWKLSLTYQDEIVKDIQFSEVKILPLPQDESIYQVSSIDVFISQSNRTLLATINSKGLLKSYKLKFGSIISWTLSHSMNTNISNCSKMNGSIIISKIAIVDESGYRLTIWDIKQKVLEYEETLPRQIKDLDWTFINPSKLKTTSNAILSIGFDRYVLLYTQLRYDYTNNVPTYANIKKIDISDFTSHEIGDSIWLDDGLIIGSGNQFFIDDKWIKLGTSNTTIDSTIRQLLTGYNSDSNVIDISNLVCILNGPLPVYHPQFLIQSLYMNQIEYCEEVLVNLFQHLRKDEFITWDLNMEDIKPKLTRRQSIIQVFTDFDSELANLLIDKLIKISLPLLTRHQQSTLISIILVIKDLKSHFKTLDLNGVRFMIGFKLFQLNKKQKYLNMRDINWALHSDNKDVLLNDIYVYYKFRLSWDVVKSTGLVYWIKLDKLIKLMEDVAKNEFSKARDPQGLISLLYLALKKKQILITLWRTSTSSEKTKMLKFLSNDFTQPRWKSAALKNAFVLLGKHRYLDAAYFFLLGDSPWDSCSTLATKCNDIPLAIAIAKIYPEDDSVLLQVIEKYIIPTAVNNGDKWITSWIFWQLNKKEISIQALIKSPNEIITEQFKDIILQGSIKSHSFLQDDPVLILLFNDLRTKKLNYLKGSLGISKLEEFQFIIKVCMIYTRMGCDYLSLLLIKNWNFISTSEKDVENGDIEFEKSVEVKSQPPVQEFEEPDMSAFEFGF
ncbi:unnamed protein product [Candida verbasci]|uniref:RAVE complex protein Rav1 C-terminal domain-containing protein n=1 Tax=Candida verbasci TaxID=1227364 RepID=A0A9W4TXK1_9ASCO|nr:unnamed protein product [Candida verbasci]